MVHGEAAGCVARVKNLLFWGCVRTCILHSCTVIETAVNASVESGCQELSQPPSDCTCTPQLLNNCLSTHNMMGVQEIVRLRYHCIVACVSETVQRTTSLWIRFIKFAAFLSTQLVWGFPCIMIGLYVNSRCSHINTHAINVLDSSSCP